MFPPHLPPPTCDVERHRQWERVKFLLVATFFGLAAGISGAAVLLGWIWPNFNDGINWLIARSPLATTRADLQISVETKMRDKIFAVYKKETIVGGAAYFSPSDKVGDAVVAVNSGWILMRLPTLDVRTKDWVVVANDGTLFHFGKTLVDKRAGILYALLTPVDDVAARSQEQFRVTTFNTTISNYDALYIFQDNQWLPATNYGLVPRINNDHHLDSVHGDVFNLNNSFKNDSIVIDGQGNLVGFVIDSTTVLPVWSAGNFLNGISERQKIIYPSLGVEGWYSSEKILVVDNEKISGFIVDVVSGNKTQFQRGDIISAVNGRPLTADSLWYTTVGDTLRVQVLRSGKLIELLVPLIQIAS